MEIQGPGEAGSVLVGGGWEKGGEPSLLLSWAQMSRKTVFFKAGAAFGARDESPEELWEPGTIT